jgi:hypothetical protein
VTPEERRAYARGLREAAVLIQSAAEHRAPLHVIADELEARAEAEDTIAERQRLQRQGDR